MLKVIGRTLGYSILAALIALVFVQFWFLLHIWYWVDHNPTTTAFMDARLERLQGLHGGSSVCARRQDLQSRVKGAAARIDGAAAGHHSKDRAG